MNIFLIETPLQLLNAIEAKNYFKLANNHLLVFVETTGYDSELFKLLVCEDDWDEVRFINLYNKKIEFKSKLLGHRISEKVQGWGYDYQQFLNRNKLDGIVHSFGRCKNIFLGNYLRDYIKYMRHFANTLEHEHLYILDDGTDALLINNERKDRSLRKDHTGGSGSYISRLKAKLRKSLIEWNDKDADKIIFFTAYDMDVGYNDHLVRNEYKYLREKAASVVISDNVFFLGQPLVDDLYMKNEVYFDYLRKIKRYFADEKLVYIPHPRESVEIVGKIKEYLDLDIKRFNVPIEYEISIKGNKPKVLASFFCSALQNCKIILDQQKIKAIYIPPEHLMRGHELTQTAYEYFKKNANVNFEIVKL